MIASSYSEGLRKHVADQLTRGRRRGTRAWAHGEVTVRRDSRGGDRRWI